MFNKWSCLELTKDCWGLLGEIQTETPVWNCSSCKECGKTFASKTKPRIPVEVLLKLKEEKKLQGTCFQSGCSTLTANNWAGCGLENQFSDWHFYHINDKRKDKRTEEMEKEIWKICKFPNTCIIWNTCVLFEIHVYYLKYMCIHMKYTCIIWNTCAYTCEIHVYSCKIHVLPTGGSFSICYHERFLLHFKPF